MEGRVRRWRYRLFGGLALLWALFFVQALFPPDGEQSLDLTGPNAGFWAVVQIGLVALTWAEWRRRVRDDA